MRSFICCIALMLITNSAFGVGMRKEIEKKSNFHPCAVKKCTKEEAKKAKRYAILYNKLGKEPKKAPALRDRF